jgi:hypothetical protein
MFEYFIYGLLGLIAFYLLLKIGAWAIFQSYFQVKQLHDCNKNNLNKKKEE